MQDISRTISNVRHKLCQRSKRRPWTVAFPIVVRYDMKRPRPSLTRFLDPLLGNSWGHKGLNSPKPREASGTLATSILECVGENF